MYALSPTSNFEGAGRLFFCTHCLPRRLLWLLEVVGQDAREACQFFSENKNNGTLGGITSE